LDDHGYTPKPEVYAALLAEWHLRGVCPETLSDDFHVAFAKHAVAYAGMVPMLDALRRQGLRLGLVSNGTHQSQAPKVAALALEQYLDAILISEVEGVPKPEREIFCRALERVGASPSHAVFVGDHPVFDIATAKSLGLKTVWKRNNVWSAPDAPDATIETLTELEDALGMIDKQIPPGQNLGIG
jgi:putative hydrolase of the HAD superfamily